MDTNVDDKTDNHLLINKTKLSNEKNNKLSTRKGKKVETKSNQIVKKIDDHHQNYTIFNLMKVVNHQKQK